MSEHANAQTVLDDLLQRIQRLSEDPEAAVSRNDFLDEWLDREALQTLVAELEEQWELEQLAGDLDDEPSINDLYDALLDVLGISRPEFDDD